MKCILVKTFATTCSTNIRIFYGVVSITVLQEIVYNMAGKSTKNEPLDDGRGRFGDLTRWRTKLSKLQGLASLELEIS